MKVYVELRHIIAVDLPADYYTEGNTDPLALADDAAQDDAFYEFLHNGPHAMYDSDWEVLTSEDADWIDRIRRDCYPTHEIEVRLIGAARHER